MRIDRFTGAVAAAAVLAAPWPAMAQQPTAKAPTEKPSSCPTAAPFSSTTRATSAARGRAKYMDQLMTRYFQDAKFSEANRPLFAFAAYNAGPGNIARMRKEAEKRGLDPDKWFDNVELVVAEKIGMETTTYVRNIYKYYAAYRLTLEAEEAARKAREAVAPGKS